MTTDYTYSKGPKFPGKAVWTPETGWTDDGPSTVWVCTDCYFAHHYGATEVDGEWFAGESDEPCDREPLALLAGQHLADNTDSETGEGIDGFSWWTCHGCGSTLGGARYRLAVFGETS